MLGSRVRMSKVAPVILIALSACAGSDGTSLTDAMTGANGAEDGISGHWAVQPISTLAPGVAGRASSNTTGMMTIPPVPGEVMGLSTAAAGASAASSAAAGTMPGVAGMGAAADPARTADSAGSAATAGVGGAPPGAAGAAGHAQAGNGAETDDGAANEEAMCQVMPITAAMRKTYRNMDDDYYQKYASADGIIVATGTKVVDEAVKRYCQLITEMFGNKDVRKGIVDAKMWFTMISESEQLSSLPQINKAYGRSLNARARGLGGLNPTICAEDSIMCKVGEPWYDDCICPHETGHTLYSSGIEKVPELSRRLSEITRNARASGRLANNYVWMDGNESGMMAWGVQAWYNCALEGQNGAYRTDINTRAELQKEFPDFYQFLSELFPTQNKYQDCYAK